MKIFTNLFFIVFIFSSIQTLAVSSNKCSKLLNDGWFKTYKFGGVGEQVYNAITQETKKEGSVTAFSNTTTEGTTAISDPGYTSNVMLSQTQSTSSWGDCSLFALKLRQEQQIAYIEQNILTIEREIAFGQGGHLDSLADFNFCDTKSNELFKSELKNNFKIISAAKTAKEKVIKIKSIIGSNEKLNTSCYNQFIYNS